MSKQKAHAKVPEHIINKVITYYKVNGSSISEMAKKFKRTDNQINYIINTYYFKKKPFILKQ